MIKYFEVVAKCGHVGKNKFYAGKFYLVARSASEAANSARYMGRVKHDHPDAIIDVFEISYDEYVEGQEKHSQEAYFNCKSKYEQNKLWNEIVENVFDEEKAPVKNSNTRKDLYFRKDKIRNPHNYIKLNDYYEMDEYVG